MISSSPKRTTSAESVKVPADGPACATKDTGVLDRDRGQRSGRVTSRTAARLAWSLWGLAMALEVAAIPLWLANHAVLLTRFGTAEDFDPHVFLAPGYATVGAVIAARQRNRIGWLFLAFGLLAALHSFDNAVFVRGGIVTPGSLPAVGVVGWVGLVLWPSGFLFLCLLLLLFPDGRLPSPGWRPVALALAISWSAVILSNAFAPGTTIQQGVRLTNPVGVQALGYPVWKAVAQGALVIAVATLAAAALAPLLRFRRADPVQRQQLKWFAFVIGICAVSMMVAFAVQGVLLVVATVLSDVAIAGVVVGLPAAVGLAILRYRLYDIDRLINRTLVYATLTAILGLGYAGAVLALGQLFGGVGERTPSWAVAGVTLAVAALFQPARRRIQTAVDRRFNRRKHNTAQTIQAFSTRLRDQIDLDTLSAELLAVVDQTMEPTRVSFWLRPPPHGSSDTTGSAPRPTPWAY
jgi:hypothetical protein